MRYASLLVLSVFVLGLLAPVVVAAPSDHVPATAFYRIKKSDGYYSYTWPPGPGDVVELATGDRFSWARGLVIANSGFAYWQARVFRTPGVLEDLYVHDGLVIAPVEPQKRVVHTANATLILPPDNYPVFIANYLTGNSITYRFEDKPSYITGDNIFIGDKLYTVSPSNLALRFIGSGVTYAVKEYMGRGYVFRNGVLWMPAVFNESVSVGSTQDYLEYVAPLGLPDSLTVGKYTLSLDYCTMTMELKGVVNGYSLPHPLNPPLLTLAVFSVHCLYRAHETWYQPNPPEIHRWVSKLVGTGVALYDERDKTWLVWPVTVLGTPEYVETPSGLYLLVKRHGFLEVYRLDPSLAIDWRTVWANIPRLLSRYKPLRVIAGNVVFEAPVLGGEDYLVVTDALNLYLVVSNTLWQLPPGTRAVSVAHHYIVAETGVQDHLILDNGLDIPFGYEYIHRYGKLLFTIDEKTGWAVVYSNGYLVAYPFFINGYDPRLAVVRIVNEKPRPVNVTIGWFGVEVPANTSLALVVPFGVPIKYPRDDEAVVDTKYLEIDIKPQALGAPGPSPAGDTVYVIRVEPPKGYSWVAEAVPLSKLVSVEAGKCLVAIDDSAYVIRLQCPEPPGNIVIAYRYSGEATVIHPGNATVPLKLRLLNTSVYFLAPGSYRVYAGAVGVLGGVVKEPEKLVFRLPVLPLPYLLVYTSAGGVSTVAEIRPGGSYRVGPGVAERVPTGAQENPRTVSSPLVNVVVAPVNTTTSTATATAPAGSAASAPPAARTVTETVTEALRPVTYVIGFKYPGGLGYLRKVFSLHSVVDVEPLGAHCAVGYDDSAYAATLVCEGEPSSLRIVFRTTGAVTSIQPTNTSLVIPVDSAPARVVFRSPANYSLLVDGVAVLAGSASRGESLRLLLPVHPATRNVLSVSCCGSVEEIRLLPGKEYTVYFPPSPRAYNVTIDVSPREAAGLVERLVLVGGNGTAYVAEPGASLELREGSYGVLVVFRDGSTFSAGELNVTKPGKYTVEIPYNVYTGVEQRLSLVAKPATLRVVNKGSSRLSLFVVFNGETRFIGLGPGEEKTFTAVTSTPVRYAVIIDDRLVKQGVIKPGETRVVELRGASPAATTSPVEHVPHPTPVTRRPGPPGSGGAGSARAAAAAILLVVIAVIVAAARKGRLSRRARAQQPSVSSTRGGGTGAQQEQQPSQQTQQQAGQPSQQPATRQGSPAETLLGEDEEQPPL